MTKSTVSFVNLLMWPKKRKYKMENINAIRYYVHQNGFGWLVVKKISINFFILFSIEIFNEKNIERINQIPSKSFSYGIFMVKIFYFLFF
jgi:hypothetical protein